MFTAARAGSSADRLPRSLPPEPGIAGAYGGVGRAFRGADMPPVEPLVTVSDTTIP